MMTLEAVRKYAMSLEAVTEEQDLEKTQLTVITYHLSEVESQRREHRFCHRPHLLFGVMLEIVRCRDAVHGFGSSLSHDIGDDIAGFGL